MIEVETTYLVQWVIIYPFHDWNKIISSYNVAYITNNTELPNCLLDLYYE